MSEHMRVSPPLYMGFPDIWELADGPNPTLLKQYLDWIFKDEERLKSAAAAMQQVAEFNALHVAVERDNTGTVTKSLQLNFYSRFTGGNEDPHGHSRDALTIWYSDPNTRQIITRWGRLPNPPEISGQPVSVLSIKDPEPLPVKQEVANIIIDKGDGKRPDYAPVKLDLVKLRKLSTTYVAPLGSQDFSCHEIHDIGIQWGKDEDMAISVHVKYAEQPQEYNSLENLVRHKGFSPDSASTVHSKAARLVNNLPPGARLGPITPLYLTIDTDVAKLKTSAAPTGNDNAVAYMKKGQEMIGRIVKLG